MEQQDKRLNAHGPDNQRAGQEGCDQLQQDPGPVERSQGTSDGDRSSSGSGSNHGDGRPNDASRAAGRDGSSSSDQQHGGSDAASREGRPDGNHDVDGSGVGHALRQGRGQFADETFDRNASPEGSEPDELEPGSSTDGASIVSPSGARRSHPENP